MGIPSVQQHILCLPVAGGIATEELRAEGVSVVRRRSAASALSLSFKEFTPTLALRE
jgi:hypothetical protein